MSYSQSGYGPARSVAKKTDKNITSLQEIRARKVAQPAQGTNGFSSHADSAAGMPGYYSSQRGPAVTKRVYRNLAALGNRRGGFGADEAANRRAFYEAQGITIGADDPASWEDIDRQAMLKWADKDQLQGFGVKLERDDVEFLEEKRAEELQFRFDEWLARRIDLNDPANQRWFQEIYPEFYERRERFIDDKINLEAALAKIKLRGVKDKSELQLLYAINAGLLQPSTIPLFRSAGPQAGTDYQEGMVSVLQWFSPSGRDAATRAPSNVAGSSTGTWSQPHIISGFGGGVI